MDVEIKEKYYSALLNECQKGYPIVSPAKFKSIDIFDAMYAKPLKIELYGESTQSTRTGKNLWNNSQVVDKSDYILSNSAGFKLLKTINGGITPQYKLDLKADVTYCISCKMSYDTKSSLLYCQWKTDEGTTIWTPNIKNGVTLFTPNQNIVGVVFYLQGTENDETYVEVTNLQIEEGSTSTEYEAYGKSPSTDYPSEIESISGRNLFNKSDITGGWIGVNNNQIYDTYTEDFSYTNYIKVNPNTIYTLNFHNASSLSGGGIMEYDSNKAWLNIGLAGTQQIITFTTSENTHYIRFTVRNDSLNYIQLERGSIATGYVPYNNITVKSTGKNLFNKEITTTGKYINSNGEIVEYYSYSITDYMPVIANKVYSYQGITEYSEYGAFYDKNKNLISTFMESTIAENQKITVPMNAEYVRFTIINTNNDIDNFQLELGDIATEYEPYVSNQANITLLHPLRSLHNGVCDRIYKKDGKWYDEKKIDSFILDGSADEKIGYDTKNTAFYYYGHENLAKKPVNNSIVCVMSNYFKGETANNCVKNSYNHCLGFNTNSNLWIRYNELTTVADFKTWLSTHNTEVLYELITPVVTEITDTNTIAALEEFKMLNGINHIEVNALMSLDYFGGDSFQYKVLEAELNV